MTAPKDCPQPTRLQELLQGKLPHEEQAEVTRHLDTCSDCQNTLEQLAVGGQAPAPLEHLRQPSAAETALRRAMAQLKGDVSEAPTQTGPTTGRASELDFLAPPERPDTLGRLGPYDVVGVVGQGGMGIVLRAFDASLQRPVALKVLAPHLAVTEVNRKRFIREARAAAAVRHEHVVAVHAVDETAPLPYLVMEYIQGTSLQDRLDGDGPPPLEEILQIASQTAAGLAAAHAQGLIHRDIKPANVLLADRAPGAAVVKITDFGLARAVDDTSLTQNGVVAGTPQYMAPEQAHGETLDHRADLFSLGSLLYALCTGRPPFGGQGTVAVLFNVCTETPRPIRELNQAIPDWLVAIVQKLHAKKPEDRFQSAAEVAELLGQHLAHLRHPTLVPMPRGPEMAIMAPYARPSPHELIRAMGREYRSQRTLWGLPLVHYATGFDPQTGRKRIARGIIAIGDVAVGGIAFGGVALGGIAVGGCAIGGIALGGLAVALLLALGGGAVAAGVALGGGAVGYYAFGGGAFGVHPLGGNTQDREAIQFFARWLGDWVHQLGRRY